jgi:hypothetical protein
MSSHPFNLPKVSSFPPVRRLSAVPESPHSGQSKYLYLCGTAKEAVAAGDTQTGWRPETLQNICIQTNSQDIKEFHYQSVQTGETVCARQYLF